MRSYIVLILFTLYTYDAGAQEGWQQVYSSGETSIYVRKVENVSIKQLKLTTKFNCTTFAFLDLLLNFGSQTQYFYGCLEAREAKNITATDHIFYQKLYMPWPFQNRDGYFHQRICTDSLTSQTDVTTTAVGSFQPQVKGLVRIGYMHSHWHITPVSGNSIYAEYQLEVDPGGYVPAWLVNMFIKEAPLNTVNKMRTMIQNRSNK